MKNFLLTLILASTTIISFAQTTAIPDPSFEAYLVAEGFDTDGVINGQILTADAQNIDTIVIPAPNVSTFAGMETFTNLKYLSISGFNGNSVDLQGLVSLETLHITYSAIDSVFFNPNMPLKSINIYTTNLVYLDLTECPQLNWLSAKRSQLDSINLNANNLLSNLDLSWNELTYINVDFNINLKYLSMPNNHLKSINTSNLDSLLSINLIVNELTSLDVSHNQLLNFFMCDTNQIEKLDVSQNPLLAYLYCNNNNLNELNLQNGSNHLIAGFGFKAENNPNLTCIQVDSVSYSNNTWTNIDPQSYFSTYCGYDLGIEDLKTQTLRLFPNPTSKEFTVQLPEVIQQGTLQIFNAMGQEVFRENIVNQSELQLNINQPAGFYFVKVRSSKKVFTAHLLID